MRWPTLPFSCLLMLVAATTMASGGSYDALRWFWGGSGGRSNHEYQYLPRGGSTGSHRSSLIVVRVKDGNGRTVFLRPASTQVTRRVVTGVASKPGSSKSTYTVTTRTIGGVSSSAVKPAARPDTMPRPAPHMTPPAADSKYAAARPSPGGKGLPPAASPKPKYLPPAASPKPKYLPPAASPKPKYLPPAAGARPDSQYLPPAAEGTLKAIGAGKRRPQTVSKEGERPLVAPHAGVAGIGAGMTEMSSFMGVPDLVLPEVAGRPEVTGVPDLVLPQGVGAPDPALPGGADQMGTAEVAPPSGKDIRRNLSGRADGSVFFGILPVFTDQQREGVKAQEQPELATFVSRRPGKCPLVDMTKCPARPDTHPPACSNDGQCPSERRCCYDPCVAHNKCVQPVLQ